MWLASSNYEFAHPFFKCFISTVTASIQIQHICTCRQEIPSEQRIKLSSLKYHVKLENFHMQSLKLTSF